MGRACSSRGTEKQRMHILGGENLDERESLEGLALKGIIQLQGSSRNECGLGSSGSEQKPHVVLPELGNELPRSVKYENF